MNSVKLAIRKSRWFSSLHSESSSSTVWISPLQYLKTTSRRPDPPTEVTNAVEVPRKPKFISHESAVNLIKREKNPQRALEIFNKVSNQKGFSHNNATYAVILDKLAHYEKFKAVDAIIHQMTYESCKFNEGIFLNLMKHFSKCSLHERVVDMFSVIQPIVREKPSLKAISTCLNLLLESDQVDLARTFLLNTKRTLNLKPNTCIFNILVKHHCKNGNLESAFEVVKEMKTLAISCPNLITYSTLMDGLCKSDRLEEALDLFEEMVSEYQILPDALTYNILITGFCRTGKVDRAKKILDFMRKNGCNPNTINYTTLMNGFSKEGRLKEAKEIFDEMKNAGLKPDKIGYTTLITCLCRSGGIDEAVEVLKEMKECGCRADAVTFNIILGGLCNQNRFDEALEMLERLPQKGVYLNKASYRIVLNFLCKEGELEKATGLLGLMLSRGFVPHFATSNDLLVKLSKAQRAADAMIILFRLVNVGFNPELETWSLLIELICRERKLLVAFELLDELLLTES